MFLGPPAIIWLRRSASLLVTAVLFIAPLVVFALIALALTALLGTAGGPTPLGGRGS
jgi:hypothetical protein